MALSERLAYVHCKPDGTPFYVGKGSRRRAKYLGERNPRHQATVAKYGPKNILVGFFPCSDSDTAYLLEEGLIKRFHAMGHSLANLTAGGDGGKDPSPETRVRLSKAAKVRGISGKCREANVLSRKGKPLSLEHKEKIRISLRGRVFSQEHRQNISSSAKKRGLSPLFREASRQACSGRVVSQEERAKRSLSMKATLAAKRSRRENST
jgi:hypothetical protein